MPEVPALPKPKSSNSKTVWIGILAAVGMPVLLVAAFLTFNFLYVKWEESHDIVFDKELWSQGSKERIYSATALSIDAPRIKMYRDLLKQQLLIGKTREEIIALLGQPENYSFRSPWNFNYWLGLQRGPMKMDSAWLC